jgi:SOUL heme-binding protein/Uncharacterized conserved protein (DUF2358)
MSFYRNSPILTILIILLELLSRTITHSWTLGKTISRRNVRVSLTSQRLIPTTTKTTTISSLTTTSDSQNDPTSTSPIDELKQILQREYVTFFNPMRKEFYASNVTFQDPLTSLVGIDAYQQNVDMLAGRTLLGSLLFEDATISLHSITGGEIMDDNDDDNNYNNNKDTNNGLYQDIVTRWTLRFTMKVLPWKPTARFSGISVYKIQSRNEGQQIQIIAQQDYWDSINIVKPQNPTILQRQSRPQDWYQTVDRRIGLQDFLQQIRPTLSLQASQAAPELPYELLRRGSSYDVRRYPSSYVIQVTYTGRRRDEALTILGSLTRTTTKATTHEGPLGPAIIQVQMDDTTSIISKTMQWPLTFALPGSNMASMPIRTLQEVEEYIKRNTDTDSWDCRILSIPSRVVAVMEFSDASLEPVIRKVDYQLRQVLQKDGLLLPSSKEEEEEKTLSSVMTFAQYDAVYSMGKRRGEVWMELKDENHPWEK